MEPDRHTPSLFQDAEELEESPIAGLFWADIVEAPALTALTITVATSGDQRTVVASSAPPAVPPAVLPAAPTTAPDTRPPLRETDLLHTVKLTPSPGQVEYIVDSLMTTYSTPYSCDEMMSCVRSLFCLRRDVGLFFRERVLQSFMSRRSAQDVIEDIIGLLDLFIGDQ